MAKAKATAAATVTANAEKFSVAVKGLKSEANTLLGTCRKVGKTADLVELLGAEQVGNVVGQLLDTVEDQLAGLVLLHGQAMEHYKAISTE